MSFPNSVESRTYEMKIHYFKVVVYTRYTVNVDESLAMADLVLGLKLSFHVKSCGTVAFYTIKVYTLRN